MDTPRIDGSAQCHRGWREDRVMASGEDADEGEDGKFAHWGPIVHFARASRKTSARHPENHVNRRLLAGIVVAVTSLPAVLSAQRQSSFDALARNQLDQAGTTWKATGFADRGEVRRAVLNAHEADTISVRLSVDSQYVLLGTCDRDCGDVDFIVHDSAGALVGTDGTSDNHPWLSLAPKTTGAYTLRVIMVSCSVEPCYYALQWLSRAAPPATR